jgi:peptidoglycan-associated lipoprotein
MQQDTEFFKANTVHFAFDRSAVRAEDRSKIEAVGAHLKSDPTHRVRIAGYCDERGTVEYNVSLGEKRALAVREFLINLGISGDRIYTISFGESDPVDPAHTDAAYAKNRRAEFILLKP